jgi:hypothetical protein
MQLSLRPTVIAGDKLPNDYCVIHDSRSVGRIRLAEERASRGTIWCWHVNPPLPIPPWCNGSADCQASNVVDLMDALRQSLKSGPPRTKKSPAKKATKKRKAG